LSIYDSRGPFRRVRLGQFLALQGVSQAYFVMNVH